MKAIQKIIAGGAAVAAISIGAAAPAAAQYYPGTGGYGGGVGDIITGAILNSILRGGNPYGSNPYYGRNDYDLERAAVQQCAQAAEARLNGSYGYNQQYGQYGQYPQYGGYNQPYGYNNAAIRVTQIDRVDRTRKGNMRVYGRAGGNYQGNYGGYNQPYGGYGQPYGGYGQPYGYQTASGQYSFSCKYERNGRISDLRVNRA